MMHARIAHAYTTADSAIRADRLLERIKIEVRWLMIAPGTWSADSTTLEKERAAITLTWPIIHDKQFAPFMTAATFYNIVECTALAFARAIELRRRRQGQASR